MRKLLLTPGVSVMPVRRLWLRARGAHPMHYQKVRPFSSTARTCWT